jgi:hypothetical protein
MNTNNIADDQPHRRRAKETKKKNKNESAGQTRSSSSGGGEKRDTWRRELQLRESETYSAVLIKVLGHRASEKDGDEEEGRISSSFSFLSLDFIAPFENDDDKDIDKGVLRCLINGSREERRVCLERVATKRRNLKTKTKTNTTTTTTTAFAAMDEIRIEQSSSFPTPSVSSCFLRFTVTNEKNERVCEGRLNPFALASEGLDGNGARARAVSIWATSDGEEKEAINDNDNDANVLSAIKSTREEARSDKMRLEISFVGENATVKASCEVPATTLFVPAAGRRRLSSSSREQSPTPSERGGEGSEKSVSWHEFNVDRREDFLNGSSVGGNDDDDDDLNLSSSSSDDKEEKLKHTLMRKNNNKGNSKLVSCLRELIPKVELPTAVSSSGNMILRKIEDSKTYAHDTTALIRAQYAELTKEWNHTKAKLNSCGEIISDVSEEEDSIRGTNSALVAMQRMTIVDDGMRNVVNGRAGKASNSDSSSEHHAKELSWFSAGVRIGVGVGLGTCLGVGIGVGILVNGMVAGKDKIARIGTVVKSKVTRS